jgi:hypothetical protein
MVALMPQGLSSRAAADIASKATLRGIDARVAIARISKSRVDEIETALVAAHSKAGSIGSIITFDAERQVVTVASDAPETAFEDVIRRYGAEVEYLPGGAEFQSSGPEAVRRSAP